jgi:transposase InsO family protein
VVLRLLRLTKHIYYYRPKAGIKGRKPSTHTPQLQSDGSQVLVSNEDVVDTMVAIKSQPETDYGYKAMTAALMLLGFIINRKKVHRLMKQRQLLHEEKEKAPRPYVRYRRVNPAEPLTVLEMDIKFQWVVSHQQYAYILTIIDCFTRKVLHWQVAYSIKKEQVISAWQYVIVNYLQPYQMLEKKLTIEVRNDNDSRFWAKQVQQYMAENHLNQMFTHPYTPEENGHIESFHAILGRSLGRKTFYTIIDLEAHLKNFYHIYNHVRLHGSLDHLSPVAFWNLWQEGLIESLERKNKPMKHSLKVPHYQLSGNGSLREASGLPVGQQKQTQAISL